MKQHFVSNKDGIENFGARPIIWQGQSKIISFVKTAITHDFYKFLQLRHFLESLLKDNRIAFIFLISYRKTIPFFNFLQKEDFCFLYYIV